MTNMTITPSTPVLQERRNPAGVITPGTEEAAGTADTYTPGFQLLTPTMAPAAAAGAGQGTAAAGLQLPRWIEPWGEVVQAAQQGGSLDKLLTPELKSKIEKAVTDVHNRGVRFSGEKQGMFNSYREELTPRQVVAYLDICTAHYLSRLSVTIPGHPEFELEGLGTLAAAGQFVMGPKDVLIDSLEGLAQAGFDKDLAESYVDALGNGNLSIQFYRGGKNKFGDNLETYVASTMDEVLAVNAIAGSGSMQGIADTHRMECIREGIKQGWVDKDKALPIYRDHGKSIPLTVDPMLPPLVIEQPAMANIDSLKKSLSLYRSAYRQYMLPVIAQTGNSTTLAFHKELYVIDGALPIEARIESFAIMAAAGGLYPDIQALHKELLDAKPRGLEAIRRAQVIAPQLQKKDLEGARRTLADLNKLDRDPNADCYQELYCATGSHNVARNGVTMVRIPTFCGAGTPESLSDRKGAYIRIAQALPESDRDKTPEVYQEMLIHRRPDEPISKAGERMSALITMCMATGMRREPKARS